MLNRRFPFYGLLAVLLALMGQLGFSAIMPRPDPLAQIIGAEILCHTPAGTGGTPTPAPMRPLDCLICPLCVAMYAPPVILVFDAAIIVPSAVIAVLRSELPPTSTAPPSSRRPPSQLRAPPSYF